ncbi:MAG: FAD-dependent oxidoreductase, partial [Clostridia bacterium]
KVYIKKQDGTLIGDGIEIGGSDVDLSKITMSMSGQTLKLMNDGTQVATVEIPTAVVTDEQLSTTIQSKIDDGSLSTLSIKEGSLTENLLTDELQSKINNNAETETGEKYKLYVENNGQTIYGRKVNESIKNGLVCDFDMSKGNGDTLKSKIGSNMLTLSNFANDGNDGWVNGGLKFNNTTAQSNVSSFAKAVTSIPNTYPKCMEVYFEFLADFNSTLVFTFGDIRFVYDNKTFSGRIFYDYINTDGTAKKDQAENYLHFTKPLIGKHLVQINQLENGFEVYFDGELVKEKIISDFKSWATTTDNIEIGYKPISWTLNNVILYSAKSYNRKLTLKECLQNYKALTIPIADRIIDTTDWEYVNYMQKNYPLCKTYKGIWSYPTSENFYTESNEGDWWINNFEEPFEYNGRYFLPNDIIYFDGSYLNRIRMKQHISPKLKYDRYDVVIIGGGAGGVACAYALKDSGYKVLLIEKLDSLGGTHCNGGCVGLIANPITGTWFKDICQQGYKEGWITFDTTAITDTDTFETLWTKAFYHPNPNNNPNNIVQSHINVDPWYLSKKYHDDLNGSIEILYNTEFIESHLNSDKDRVLGVKVKDLISDEEYSIYGEYFVDASADGVLCRSHKVLDTDFYIGADPYARFKESALNTAFEGNHYDINTVELAYRVSGTTYKNYDKTRPASEKDGYKSYPDVTTKVNAFINGIVSPSYGTGIKTNTFIDCGNDVCLNDSIPRAMAHSKRCAYAGGTTATYFAETMPMLAIRESYRIKCDRMLKQSDCESTASSSNIASEHTIALSSWYVDIHMGTTSIGSVNSTYNNGVPYESLMPSAFKNVLIGSRCFGLSHIAQCNFRLVKTIMSIGYACGHALKQCRAGWLDDVRNVDITQLQTDIGIADAMAKVEKILATT